LRIDKKGKKEKPKRDYTEALQERIVTTITTTFFSQILGEMGGLAHVASQ
jgi:hypothetical protein